VAGIVAGSDQWRREVVASVGDAAVAALSLGSRWPARSACAGGGSITLHNDGGAVFTACLPLTSTVPA
jgi:hypothetical protein